MSTTDRVRVDLPISKIDFANGTAKLALDATDPQPGNHALVAEASLSLGRSVMVNSRALVGRALRNPDLFSSENLIEQGNSRPLIPLGIDPPDHSKYRKLLNPLFTPRRINALEDDIAHRVNYFIDSFIERGSCDFTAEFAELFPSSVFLDLMGLPWEDLDALVQMRDGLLRPGHGTDLTSEERTAAQRATADQVYEYFDRALDERTIEPRDDLLTKFLDVEASEADLTRDEVLSICFVLLTAGLDTVTDALTCFWARLAQRPELREQLVNDPSVIPDAVEELLRWETPVPYVVRWAREDAELGDSTVSAGHHVMVNLGAANLDDSEFEDPMDVRFNRPLGARHYAFGAGVHHCLGAHLARKELTVALREWHRRIPNYQLAPDYQVRYLPPLRFVPDLQISWSTEATV
jgi:cytochrome P450